MAHIDARSREQGDTDTLWQRLLPLCVGLLSYPFTVFAAAAGFFFLGVWQTYRCPKAVLIQLWRSGFLAIALLMVISASLAVYPGEAFLQLTHFIPFFWFWAFLTIYLKATSDPWRQIYRWALILVLAAVPLNIIGIVEYALKILPSASLLPFFSFVDWLYLGDLNVPRAFSLFDYPNTLASYLTMILGLNLGLLFLNRQDFLGGPQSLWGRCLLWGNVPLTLICLFCSGSRNGYLAAIALLLVGLFSIRSSRWLRSLGLAGIALIIVSTFSFGLAGRTPSWDWVTNDPRVKVWALAIDMVSDQPIWGQGLGNYKLLYNGEVPGYDYIAHAHNLWLTLASETGLPVMLLLTAAVGLICFRGWRAGLSIRRQTNRYAILLSYQLCFLGITLFSLLDVTLFEARVNLLAWLSLSVIAASPQLSQMVQSED